jgi:predicted NUDIX family phosphoesterase
VREQGFFVERERAERDPELKQIIPYTIVTRSSSRGAVSAHAARSSRCCSRNGSRAAGRAPAARQAVASGVGGHVEPIDAEGERGAVLERGTRRELGEELAFEGELAGGARGLLNDDSNPGRRLVHVGLVQVARASGAVARPRGRRVERRVRLARALLRELLARRRELRILVGPTPRAAGRKLIHEPARPAHAPAPDLGERAL